MSHGVLLQCGAPQQAPAQAHVQLNIRVMRLLADCSRCCHHACMHRHCPSPAADMLLLSQWSPDVHHAAEHHLPATAKPGSRLRSFSTGLALSQHPTGTPSALRNLH